MKALFVALHGGFQAEIKLLARSPLFVALTVVLAVTFLFLVSLFGLTGSRAPTAIITEDRGEPARQFIAKLAAAHHSFDLRVMDQAAAQRALHNGELAAIIVLPKDFSDAISQRRETTIQVWVDNVDTDMTADIKRALPSAIVAFGRQLSLPTPHVQVVEHDLIDHDTDFIPYLVVSGLVLDAFLIACILSAMAVAREFETGTIKLLTAAPISPLVPILGHVCAANLLATGAMIFPLLVAVYGYQIMPRHPLEVIGGLVLCTTIFSCVGMALGALLKRTLPVASLVVGLSLSLYLCSGSFEPVRLDGNAIWIMAHFAPVYYAVAILEHAFHELQVTPEPLWVHFVALLGWAVGMLGISGLLLSRAMMVRRPARARDVRRASLRWSWPRLLPSVVLTRRYRQFAGLALVALLVVGSIVWSTFEQRALMGSLGRQQRDFTQRLHRDRQQAALLLTYTNTISDMILHDKQLHVGANDPKKLAAEKLTRETLPQLDGKRKGSVLSFLYYTKLIDDARQVIDLNGADFSGGQFAGLELFDVSLKGANFGRADMRDIFLRFAILEGVNFQGANLTGANLSGATLNNVDFTNADLTDVNLGGASGTTDGQLARARSLSGATLPPDGSPEDVDREED